jgi:hypothetical protein
MRRTYNRRGKLIERLTRDVIAHQAARNEAEIRRLMGLWVSELDPVLCYGPGNELLGLGISTPIGAQACVVVRAWE